MKKQMDPPFWAGLAACVLPVAAGLLYYGALPGTMAVQWSFTDGAVSGTMPKAFAVFAIPAVFFIAQLVLYTSAHKTVWGECMMGFLREGLSWLFPVAAVGTYSVVYSANLTGAPLAPVLLCSLVGLGVLMVGAYVPQLPFGSRWGIRDEYTAIGEVHWKRIHYFAGGCWGVCGIAIILSTWLFPANAWYMLLWLLLMPVPQLYSYWRGQRHKRLTQ